MDLDYTTAPPLLPISLCSFFIYLVVGDLFCYSAGFLINSCNFGVPVEVSSGSSHCAILPQIPEFLLDIEVNSKEIDWGFPGGSVIESTCQCRRYGFDPWSRKILHAVEQLSLCTRIIEPCSRAWELKLLSPQAATIEDCVPWSQCSRTREAKR